MVPGEPPPSDPSAQTWLLPPGQAPGTRHALGTKAQASRAFLGARTRSPGWSDQLPQKGGSKRDKKIWALW